MANDAYDLIIIGAGIAGSTLAGLLAPHMNVLVLDRSVHALPGATGHAPGIVGQLNVLPVLTELARRSVKYYASIPNGWDARGGLEIAAVAGTEGVLAERAALAEGYGLPNKLLSSSDAAALAPDFVPRTNAGGLHFPADGVAYAKVCARHGQAVAAQHGAALIDADVLAVQRAPPPPSESYHDPDPAGYVVHTRTAAGERAFTAPHIVLCTGAWAGQLCPNLAGRCVAVKHPYHFSATRAPRPRMAGATGSGQQPWIRWPVEHHYARDHGDRDGVGSYDHPGVRVPMGYVAGLKEAYVAWEDRIGAGLDRAVKCLPPATAGRFEGRVVHAPDGVQSWESRSWGFNGLFTVTPDGVPLVGRIEGGRDAKGTRRGSAANEGLWCAVGLWVTHAAGGVGVLAREILEATGIQAPGLDTTERELRFALDPKRFRMEKDADLEKAAVARYSDIYNKEDSGVVDVPGETAVGHAAGVYAGRESKL